MIRWVGTLFEPNWVKREWSDGGDGLALIYCVLVLAPNPRLVRAMLATLT